MKLRVVQGDDIELMFVFDDKEKNPVDSVAFLCEALELEKKKEKTEDDVWILKIPAVDSKDFRIGKFYCYFLVTYAMGNREVHTYGDTIEVMYKYNREER